MKILELTRLYQPSVGGMERFVRDRTRIYRALGADCTVLTTTASTEKQSQSEPDGDVIRLREYTPYTIVPGLGSRLTDEYDLISVNLLGRYYSDYAILRYASRRQKIMLTPYFAFHTERFRFMKQLFESFAFPVLLSRVDVLVALTQCERRFWIERFHVDENKVVVIPPFVAPAPESPERAGTASSRSLLYVGRAGVNKKTDLLLKAFLGIPDASLTLTLTLRPCDVDGSLRDAVMNDKRISLLGYVDEEEKKRLIADAAAVVFPTSWESFGYVAFEAAAAKKPLLCSDIPVLRELHGNAGALLFRNDEEGIRLALQEFIRSDERRRKEMGEANYRNARKFSFDHACEQYAQLLRMAGYG
ncbi:MAG: glycosyltransferase family 4 protein [Acidobacteriota bacterium]